MNKHIKIITVISIFALSTTSMAINRFIVKYNPNAITDSTEKTNYLSQKARKVGNQENQARISRTLVTGAHVVILDNHLNEDEAKAFIEEAKENNDIEYIEEDRILKAVSQSQDASIQINSAWQWDMTALGQFAPNLAWIGDNFFNAWKTLKNYGFIPGKDVVVAVIDSGYTPHSNIINNLQTLNGQPGIYGYQFISDCRISGACAPDTPEKNAQISYQQNALDSGDYVDEAFIKAMVNSSCVTDDPRKDCRKSNSSWHGTHVTGTIIGSGYNSVSKTGIAGGAYGAKIVPVRVLGRGSNSTISDIINGMGWAAGFKDVGDGNKVVPSNPNPAHILNLSLGFPGQCSAAIQEAVDKIINKGIVIVAAAGNEASDVINTTPASCKGVISVAAKGPTNKLAIYSNSGATTIAASGGDNSISDPSNDPTIKNPLSGVYSAVWSSLGKYNFTDGGTWASYAGTSMATPHVSAAAAILIGILKAQNKTYTPKYISDVLQKTASNYDNCNNTDYTDPITDIKITNTNRCAAGGALDVDKAAQYVLNNPVVTTSDSDSGVLTGLLAILGAGAVGAGGICLLNHYKH